jgi:hypothetical protein
MRGPNHLTLGIAIAVVCIVGGFFVMVNEDPPKPVERAVPARAEIERAVREGEVLRGPAGAPFALRYPDGWEPMDRDELQSVGGGALAGLRSDDNSGLLTVTVRPPIEGGVAAVQRDLPGQLRRAFDDAGAVTVRRLRVAAGPAVYASLRRGESGQLQSLLVLPDVGGQSYQVGAAIRPTARDVAAQVGVMLRTFDVDR